MNKIKPYITLHLLLALYSLAGVCSKSAAAKEFLSFGFCFFYGLLLLLLAVYALLWQQALKQLPLNIAYANKAVTLVWGMIWGVVIFKETVAVHHIIGAVIVVSGVLLMVTGGEKEK